MDPIYHLTNEDDALTVKLSEGSEISVTGLGLTTLRTSDGTTVKVDMFQTLVDKESVAWI